jgi:hypothetical protein
MTVGTGTPGMDKDDKRSAMTPTGDFISFKGILHELNRVGQAI